MIKQLYPCLWFDNQAKAAAQFYTSIFKTSSIISENPIVVTFEINGKKIIALNGGPIFKINPSISFFIVCNSEQEIEQVWNGLIEEGKVLMELGVYPWSKKYGWYKINLE